MRKYWFFLLVITVFIPSVTAAQSKPVNTSSSFLTERVNKELVVPVGHSETIADIQVRFVDPKGNLTKGKTQPEVITREFTLKLGDVYSSELAKEGLQGVRNLIIVDRVSLTLEPVAKSNQAVIIVTVKESSNLSVDFGLTLPPPTALQGVVKATTVKPLSDSASGIGAGISLGVLNLGRSNQKLSLGVEGGKQKFGFDLGYRNFLKHDTGYGINVFNRRGIEPELKESERDFAPWVHRLGGGIEYFQPIAKDFNSAIGLSYQRVSIREGAFSSDIEPRDELGNSLTVSEDGQDDLLTLNFAAVLDRQDNPKNPTHGFKLRLGSDQYIPVGDASVFSNRLAANYTQYLPLPLFSFTEGARTLVLNFQGGTILGDVPPYEAFILGGSSSVRGYGASELGTSRSFIQTTAEYRYPIITVNAFKNNFDVGGTFFIDYANDLGSGDAVIGQPAVVRDKPGNGLGYGLGLRVITPVGVVRIEFGFSDRGNRKLIFKLGDRF